jgi:hypothetical protein
LRLKLRHIVALSQLATERNYTRTTPSNLIVLVQFAFKLGKLLGRVRLCGNQNCKFWVPKCSGVGQTSGSVGAWVGEKKS